MSLESNNQSFDSNRTILGIVLMSTLINITAIDGMVSNQVLSCTFCKFSNPTNTDHFLCHALSNALQEGLFSFLELQGHVSIFVLRATPDILDPFACEFGMTFRSQEHSTSKLSCDILQHSLFVQKVVTHCHQMAQAGFKVDHLAKSILLTIHGVSMSVLFVNPTLLPQNLQQTLWLTLSSFVNFYFFMR